MAKRKINRNVPKEIEDDFGYREFYCSKCDLTFEVRWIDIFDLQEITHGYVGFEIQNEYISCPKCGSNANDEYVPKIT